MPINKQISPESLQMVRAVSDNIVLARKARELSQIEIAKAIGISLNSYKTIESGEGNANFMSYVKTIEFLGLTHTLAFIAAPQYDPHGQEFRLSKKSRGER